MKFNRNIRELEENAILWWPEHLNKANAAISVIPKLLQTQDDFLKIISLSKKNPYQVFDLLEASEFPANLFLKHLCVLADYGGEPIQRLGRAFSSIFQSGKSKHSIEFSWNSNNYIYDFKCLPVRGLGNKKLFIDGEGLIEVKILSDLYRDMIILLMFGSTSTVNEEAGLLACEIGTLLGEAEVLEKYVKERYINVSRITGGATANSLGQLAQQEIVKHLSESLGYNYCVISNGYIALDGYKKESGMPFDIVVEKGDRKVGIEVSFQVTTNSTIERKSGQAADRINLMHSNGHKIAYVLDGAGNFQRKSAISNICANSDCTVAYSNQEFDTLSKWIGETLD
ncbi:restriction endonuclease [Candidatus Venteria ishoeyi]|uniref:Type-2 restriction enzyme BanI n=1 Tax=Candidatus Venteria ishoeyi TaxID=1899563 RepID=A0A1H6F4L9_9GAMM|nr:restriction endonuclease [Candidatus Venteria ishoeyi]MDM8546793.1 restriction endonuclease [Candidatus Venteria ishoeyi]SEH04209.1 Type-2 restriction enzyme BanI [Candidatus Venteria ishoeyi]